MLRHLFDLERHYDSYNVRDLDTNDIGVFADVMAVLEGDINRRYTNFNANETDGSPERLFDLLVVHFLGIDHAGHTYYASHPELERKIVESEEKVKQIIDAMDNDTVLILYGDHGMTDDGNHGGGSVNELRTMLFGYCKSGFPMLKQTKKIRQLFAENSFDDLK